MKGSAKGCALAACSGAHDPPAAVCTALLTYQEGTGKVLCTVSSWTSNADLKQIPFQTIGQAVSVLQSLLRYYLSYLMRLPI